MEMDMDRVKKMLQRTIIRLMVKAMQYLLQTVTEVVPNRKMEV
jgi:hypothetical protein